MAKRIAWIVSMAAWVLVAPPASAAGPVDVDLGVAWWFSDTKEEVGSLSVEETSDAAGAWAELWAFQRLGFAASYFESRPQGTLEGDELDYTTLDVKWRFLSATRNNYFAVGAGYETIDGTDDSTSSPRVVAEGRISAKLVYGYARAAYLFRLEDVEIEPGVTLKGDSGFEFEAGVAFKPFPFFYLFAAYKKNVLDFEDETGAELSLETSGPTAGVGFSF